MDDQVYNGGLDVAEWVLYAFFLFFFGLIAYLRREDRREGYPLEDDVSGRHEPSGGLFFTAQPKVFRLPHNGGTITTPIKARDSGDLKARRTAPWAGSPLEPVGDPLQAGIGPGAYAQRAKTPDLMLHGAPRIVPLRVAEDFYLDKRDPDPRGMPVIGADNAVAGTVTDVWVDRSEYLIRYLEVSLTDGGKRMLVPMPMAVIQRGRKRVKVVALLASQFAGAPTLASPDQITRDEEERVSAYVGGGILYATPARAEPWL
ncbi:MAG: photosynthetic reaction center subunit H [Alphaproteobacteria bacterium]|nr:MAG: photosynthetic reaction center subunit H [Alphaproteobacteria bacterium]